MSVVALPPFWSLVEAHGDELLVHARRMTGDSNGEDVLQDALLRALRAYPRLRHAEHLRAWLYRVTTTTALDHIRARRREVLIGELPETARSALRLRFVEDLDYDSIAHRLGTSTVAARQRVSTAIRTLRTQGIPA